MVAALTILIVLTAIDLLLILGILVWMAIDEIRFKTRFYIPEKKETPRW